MKNIQLKKVESMMTNSSLYGWFSIFFFIIFTLVSWMVWTNFDSWIKLEEKINTHFNSFYGQPEMTYSDGLGNGILTFLVTYGSAPFLSTLTVLIAIFFFFKGEFLIGFWFVGVISSGGIFGIVLKNLFKRKRPYNHLSVETGFSFPSGHAIASTLFFWSLILVFFPRIESMMIRVPLTIAALLAWLAILYSRLYFHAHHLGDLIVGASYGIFWVMNAIMIYQCFILF